MIHLLDAIVAFLIGVPAITVAVVTDNEQALCDRMNGVYNEQARAPIDSCPGGHWSALVNRKGQPR